MEKPRVYYLKRYQQRPKKPYLMLLGINIHRELISFLTYPEFIEFCLICKKTFKFATDNYTAHKFKIKKSIFSLNLNLTETLRYEKLTSLLQTSIFPYANIEWKKYPINFFHLVYIGFKKFFFFYHDNLIQIKEPSIYSPEFLTLFTKEFNSNIYGAVGYKNLIAVILKNSIEFIKLSQKDILNDEFTSFSKVFVYEYPKKNYRPLNIFFVNAGKSLILAYKLQIVILSENLVNEGMIPEKNINFIEPFKVLVPNPNKSTYIVVKKNELLVENCKFPQIVSLEADEKITKIETTHFDGHFHVIYSTEKGKIYMDNHHFSNIFFWDYCVLGEYMVFSNHRTSRLEVLSLKTHEKVFQGSISINSSIQFLHFSKHILIYCSGINIFIYNFSTDTSFPIELTFQDINEIKFIDPFLIIKGSANRFYGLMTLDLLGQLKRIEYNNYTKAPELELTLEEKKKKHLEEIKQKEEEEKKIRRINNN